ncbi:YfhO family protein [Streptomyces sp. ZAF1911]|uniref:YfhO family protein n=1 Tax=Streptomyces sp. ZAF1911 TaxID=2944129 RepID=UPI00237A9A9B|nr:YfhO family protein [Streptomyces sp. ZAF1911]MDD9380815.1 YfhO family protein [Streptomyces sp. ZAF1911]
MAAYSAGLATRGVYPFGPVPRADNDLRHQYVPFHTHLWDLQHGSAQGDLLFNWQSGYGVGFLGDFFTYLSNPFSLLAGLLPRQQAELSVYLVSLCSMGLAAALMTVYLGRLRPGSPWLRALLSVGYAVCGWGVAEGTVVPMWTWGLVAIPLLGIAADWCLTGRRWVLGSFFVALCWYANFYTAAMATTATALVFLVRLLLADTDWRTRGRALWRAATMTGTGLLLAAPAILVCAFANRRAQPTELYVVSVNTDPLTFLSMLIPGTHPVRPAPNVYAGVLVLLLVLTLPFQSKVRGRERLAWFSLLLLTGVSFVLTPTAKLWQGGALPHGAPFRESFVLSGMLAMAAWICLAHMPRPRALLGGASLLALLVAATYDLPPVNGQALTGVLVGGAVTTALLLFYARGLRRPARIGVMLLLAVSVFAGTVYSVYGNSVADDPRRRGPVRAQTMTELGKGARQALEAHGNWPATRADAGPGVFVTNNDALLVGGQGGAYYSSYVSVETARGLRGLGLGQAMGGRHLWPAEDPVLRALLGIGTVLEPVGEHGVTVRTLPAPPLVTLRAPGSDQTYGAPAGSVWARRQAALGARVYTVPALTRAAGPAAPAPAPAPAPEAGPGFALNRAEGWAPETWTAFTGRCAPGARAFLHAPDLNATVRADDSGRFQSFSGRPPAVSAPVRELGTAAADGRFTFSVRTPHDGQVLPPDALGCLDQAAFDAAVAGLRAGAATGVTVGGHTIEARLPEGSTGTAVLATTASPGWSCSVDGGPARAPVSYQGLLGVPLGSGGADRLACSYVPEGLRAGLGGAGAGLLLIAGVLAGALWRSRRA